MELGDLEKILSGLSRLKIAVFGDGCADIYWEADMKRSELSREIPHYPLPVYEERFSLGAGANVVHNLCALGAGDLRFVSLIGEDWRGMVFRKLLNEIKVSEEYLVSAKGLVTPAYCKPIRHGISGVSYEDPRIDFMNLSKIPEEAEEELTRKLLKAADGADILVVCDQFLHGVVTDRILKTLAALGERIPIVADSRGRIMEIQNAIVKPNEVELCQSLGLPSCGTADMQTLSRAAGELERKSLRPVLVTLGENGSIWCENGSCVHVPAYPVEPPIDFVGAGDSFLAGFAAAHSLGADPVTALRFSSLVSAVTIKKLGVTGTASPVELLRAFERYRDN